MSIPKVKTADGRYVEPSRENDAAQDLLADVSRFGESLEFDEEGNLLSGTPSQPEQAAE